MERRRERNIFTVFDGNNSTRSESSDSVLDSDVFDNSDLDSDYEPDSVRKNKRARSSSLDRDDSSTDPDVPGPSRRPRKKQCNKNRNERNSQIGSLSRDRHETEGGDADNRRNSTTENDDRDQDFEEELRDLVEDASEWVANLDNFPNVPSFTGDPGLKFPLTDDISPLDLYNKIITRDMLKLFKSQTNLYAAQSLAQSQNQNVGEHSKYKTWQTVTILEIEGFLLLLIHMSLIRKHNLQEYWTEKEIIYSPFAGKIMPRNRFQAILSMFHLNDNNKYIPQNEDNHDPLFKIRPFYEHLQTVFPSLYVPEKNIAIDEAMCGWRGKLRFKVYIKDKPVSRGIKLYMLADSKSAYVYSFEIYAAEPGLSNKPHDVCMRLLRTLLDKGYHLYVDNYYACPTLAEELVKRNTMLVGTCRSNRKGFPKDLVAEKLNVGEISFRRREDVAALKWKDKRDVYLLTTVHNPTTQTEVTTRHGTSVKPVAIRDYTQNMCATDRSDQLHAYIPLRRRTAKWWKKLFVHLYVLSIVQAHILYNMVLQRQGKKWQLHAFILELAEQLTTAYKSKQAEKAARNVAPALTTMNRLVGRHFPTPLPGTTKKIPRRACKVCNDRAKNDPNRDTNSRKRQETKYWCADCKVPLCIDIPCFIDFHTKQCYV